MKLKSGNKLRRLRRSVMSLSLDVQAIEQEHDMYRLDGDLQTAEEWFHSMPIESLGDSLAHDRGYPLGKYSLHDMKHKFKLRKLHEQKLEELELKQIEFNVAKIENILSKIKKI